MSDHAWILENLAAYLADGLEPAERDRLEQHTAECAACAAALNEARAMDATLTGLFVEARPSTALEDRVIQTLRNRPPDSWRLPMPAWLAIAAAALVLIGFTGAVASQVLVHDGLSFPAMSEGTPTGSMAQTLLGYQAEPRKNAAELAQDSRQQMMSEFELPRELNQENNQLGFYSAAQDLSTKASLEIPKRASVMRESEKSSPKGATSPPKAQPPVSQSYNGRKGFGMGDGSVHALPATGTGSPRHPTYQPPVGTGPPPATRGTQPGYFEPGKQLLATATETAPKSEVNKRSEPASVKGSGGGGAGKVEQLKERIRDEQNKAKAPPPPPDKKPQGQAGPRKIVIRTGEIEYEVQSFDAAVATITRLIKSIKGGFVATVNSDKLTNGKVRGSVVVRVPPESLDELILDLRTNLGKSGELKNQRIRSDDITKQYTDLESRLKAARAMEERLLKIIKDGKGEIKDLLAVEKELGVWRTRIEEFEGSLRYYANQVALSTLTITLYEKEIQAPFGIVEREQVQMGIEVEDVDKSYQAAQKAVREAKGRITYSKLDQPSEGQYSAHLHFEVSPDAAGSLRDRLKQLGTVARFDISRQEETQGGTGRAIGDGKITRNDTRFQVHFYNLTNVAPRETVQINLACDDVEASLKKLLARVEKAAGRVVSSSLNSTRGDQAQANLQIEVKSAAAAAMLEDIKAAGEVMRLNVTENPDRQNTTRKKRGFKVQLLALSAAAARETDEIQLACTDVAASFRAVQDAVLKARGRVRNAQLNEQDRRNVTATLDFEIRRDDEAALRAALATAGDIYTRKAIRAADAENVVDSKVHWLVTFLNQATIPPRETYKFAVEAADVDQTAKMLSALVGDRQGRVVNADIARESNGRVTGQLIYDVPLAKVHELLDALKSAGTVRVQKSVKHPEVPDSPLAIARLEVTLSNQTLIVPSDKSFGSSIRGGLSDSFTVLSWSVRLLILGLCVLLPWALVMWAIYRLVVRMRRRSTPAAPAT
ncbi:MAG TPA: DUF4349 domain-containing protein [Gemmataceae bacterium]|nr:DUF4349 domain-containing protein [Gemmataceae bacterium]